METVHQQYMEYLRLYKEIDTLYAAIAEHSGISPAMFWCMYMVCTAEGTCTATDICGCCAMSKQTVHSALQKLEREGYICLKTCENDRRSKTILLLEKGEQYAKAHLAPVFRAEEDAFSAIEEKDRVGLLRGQESFYTHLKKNMQPPLSGAQKKEKTEEP